MNSVQSQPQDHSAATATSSNNTTATDPSSNASSSVPPSLSSLIHLPIILGSSSKWRAGVVAAMGLHVALTLSPNIDEYAVTVPGQDASSSSSSIPRHRSPPDQLSLAVAQAKAQALMNSLEESSAYRSSHRQQPHLLITSDQVAHFEGEIREKPKDKAQCRNWLRQYTSSPVRVCTAIVVTHTGTGQSVSGVCHASQQFLPTLNEEVIEAALEHGDIMKCCGGFIVDLPLMKPYLGAREGSEDEVIGMPKRLLTELLLKAQNDA